MAYIGVILKSKQSSKESKIKRFEGGSSIKRKTRSITVNGIDYIWKVSEREYYAFVAIWFPNKPIPWAEVEVRIDDMWYGIFDYVKNEELMHIEGVTPKIVADIIKKVSEKFGVKQEGKEIIKVKYYKNGEVGE